MAPCLYCRQENRTFTSVEHVIPEGLGNQGLGGYPEIVLPKGVVCDKCNNGKLSALDQTLITFAPVSAMRVAHGVRTKSGDLPRGKFGNASMEMTTPGNVSFNSNSKKAFQRTPDGFKVNIRSNQKMTPSYCRRLTRALFKMTLGCIYVDHGPDLALSTRFDPIREMVLDRVKFHGYLAMTKKVEDPGSHESGLRYAFWENEGEKTVLASFAFYGVKLHTDLEIRDPKHFQDNPNAPTIILPF